MGFQYILLSGVPWAIRSDRMRAAIIAVVMAGQALTTIAVFPHQLAYFNELSGGRERGGDHLLGSNVDWGQDLIFLKQRLSQLQTRHQGSQTRQFTATYLLFHSPVDPGLLGLNAADPELAIDGQGRLRPGVYVVSESVFRGDIGPVPTPGGSSTECPQRVVERLRKESFERCGAALRIYFMPEGLVLRQG